jgi:hypothetical protein
MMKGLYIVALCVGAIAINNGCVTEDKNTAQDEIVIGPVGNGPCGSNFCTGKTFCCNASCGICAPIGGGCTQQACLTDDDTEAAAGPGEDQVSTPSAEDEAQVFPFPQQCGKNICTGGTRCCNPSCGTCAAPGDECTQQICQPTD